MNEENNAAIQVLGTMLIKVRDQLFGVMEFNPLELRTEIEKLLTSDAIAPLLLQNKKNADRLDELEDILLQLLTQMQATATIIEHIVKQSVPAEIIQTPE